ncbi:hypothetical protein HanIR_Chr01g0037991 [Helianthus annuus]|nr:hypothetical protein HanIR_Chr01g0037991 [Helianthus annuus]
MFMLNLSVLQNDDQHFGKLNKIELVHDSESAHTSLKNEHNRDVKTCSKRMIASTNMTIFKIQRLITKDRKERLLRSGTRLRSYWSF